MKKQANIRAAMKTCKSAAGTPCLRTSDAFIDMIPNSVYGKLNATECAVLADLYATILRG